MSISVAQSDFREGYYIKLTGDTVFAKIDFKTTAKKYESCLVKEGNTERAFLPQQIKAYGFINDRFYSSEISDSSFVEVLVLGAIDLYGSVDKFLLKKDNKLYTLESFKEITDVKEAKIVVEKSKWRGILAYLISDCLKDSGKQVERIKFKERDLTELILKYNDCKGENNQEIKKNLPWTKFEYGITVGFFRTKLYNNRYSYLYNKYKEKYHDFSPAIGFSLNISSPRIVQNVDFQTGLVFAKYQFSGLYVIKELNEETYYDSYFEYSKLSIPANIKYSFPERKVGLFVQGGICFDKMIHGTSKVLTEKVQSGVVETQPVRRAFNYDPIQFGLSTGFGCYKTFENLKASILLKYEFMRDLSANEISLSESRLGISLILAR